MSRNFRLTIFVLFVIGWNGISQAQTQLQEKAGLAKKLDPIAEKAMKRDLIPGMSVAVAVKNQIIYSNAFGVSDVENNVPATRKTRFRTASIAKPITAVAVLKLHEQSQIDLDKAIQKYCREFPTKKWQVTPRDLLSHTGGVRHYNKPGESTGKQFYPTLTDSLSLFKDDPLVFEPKTRFGYTTFGYTLLGCAIENVSGISFDEYLKKNILSPAGMNSTGLDHVREIIPNRARGYMKMTAAIHRRVPESQKAKYKVGNIYNATLHDTSMKIPGGGLLSTSEDLVRFVIALDEDKLLKEDTRRLMWTRQSLSNGNKTSYGLGWNLEQDAGGPKLISHSGGQAGTSTFLVFIPRFELVVAVMCNLEGVSAKSIAREIGRAVIGSQ